MSALFDLTGKTAVITGAGRGIGEGIAQTLADAGANIVCAARSTDQIEHTANAINGSNTGGRAIFHKTDVSKLEDMQALAARAVEEFGRLDIWVNNAGGSLVSAPMVELDPAEWDKTIAVNLSSVFYSVKAAVPHLGDKSAIVNISSLAGLEPFPGSAHYSASKAGVNMITKTLSMELGPKTRVNTIMPGFVPTDTVKKALNMKDEDFIQLEKDLNLPAGRLGTPEDIGALVLYLVAPSSAWMTGQNIALSGKP
jgi:NAD(P)-dependent dehydrogenase (short-subunit alcohol dehydrogenase family)